MIVNANANANGEGDSDSDSGGEEDEEDANERPLEVGVLSIGTEASHFELLGSELTGLEKSSRNLGPLCRYSPLLTRSLSALQAAA